jgi:putative transcriptional regulator
MESPSDIRPADPGEQNLSLLGSGTVLLANDVLQDPNFAATLVLVCIYSKDGGAYGLVINRPAHMPLSEIFDGFDAEIEQPREVYIGGPVQQDEVQVIQVTDNPAPDSHQIAPRIYLGGKWENLDEMVTLDESSTRLFLGYSGWAAGQLESEIQAGAWQVFRIDLEKLLTNPDKVLGADTGKIASFLDSIKR